MKRYEVVQLERKYWDEMAAIYQDGIDNGVTTFQREVPTYEQWIENHIKGFNIIIKEAEEVIGFASLTKINNREAYAGVAEVSIYIKNGQRGKGIGTILLNTLIDMSEKAGFWTLQSTVIVDNIGSKKLHLKCGFREVGYREKIAQTKYGVWRDSYLMERRSNIGLQISDSDNVISITETENEEELLFG